MIFMKKFYSEERVYFIRYRNFGNSYVLSIEPGEEVLDSLNKFCLESGVMLGAISGIGACNKAEIGLFELSTQKYHTRILTGDHEITNLSGNISSFNGQLYLHVHITLADSNYNAWGSHLTSAVISGACEIVIQGIDGRVDRKFDDMLGLNLLQL